MSENSLRIERIDSIHNPGVKRVVRLRTKKSREARGQTIVEGVREVRQALRAGLRFLCVYICREGVYHCPEDLLKEIQSAGTRIMEAGCSVYDRMAYGDRREGVLALVEQPHWTLDRLTLSAVPLVEIGEHTSELQSQR
jgi:TrmH family RNA methyltransferase